MQEPCPAASVVEHQDSRASGPRSSRACGERASSDEGGTRGHARRLVATVSRWLAACLVFVIRTYQRLLSPFLPPSCRFEPSCSEYAAQALTIHGLWKGLFFGTLRVLRCHPWHPGGYDPVPKPIRPRAGGPGDRGSGVGQGDHDGHGPGHGQALRHGGGPGVLGLVGTLAAAILARSLPALAEEAPPVRADLGEEVWILENPGVFRAQVSNYHAAIRSFMLLNEQFYQKQKERTVTIQKDDGTLERWPPPAKLAAGPKDMVSTWDAPLYPFSLHFEELNGAPRVRRALKLDPLHPEVEGDFWSLYARDPVYSLVARDGRSVTFVWPDPAVDRSTLFIERTWSLADSVEAKGSQYVLESRVRLWNVGPGEVRGRARLALYAWEDPSQHAGGTCGAMFAAPPDVLEVACGAAGSVTKKSHKDLLGGEQGLGVGASFVGVNSRYFLTAAIPAEDAATQCLAAAYRSGVVVAALQWENFILRSGEDACLPDWLVGRAGYEGRPACTSARARFGLREGVDVMALGTAYSRAVEAAASEDEKATLAAARDSLMPGRTRDLTFRAFLGPKDLDELKAVDRGLDDTIDFWVLGFLCKPMLWILRQCHDLVPSWGLAIIVLTLLVKVLTLYPTQKSMLQMRRMAELKPKMDEIRERFKDDKVKMNQAMMDLYKREKVNPLGGCLPMLLQMPIWIALYRTIYGAVDLYQAPLFLWVDDLSAPDPYFVMPLLLGGLMFLQQKMTPTMGDQTQARIMLWMMPIMFTAFMLFLPSGLVFYILVNTLLSIAHQWYVRRPRIATAKAG